MVGAGISINSIVKAGTSAFKAVAATYGDDVARAIAEYGDDIAKITGKYGDDVAKQVDDILKKSLDDAVESAGKAIQGFNTVESEVINEAKAIINSSDFACIKAAHESGQSVTINIGGRIIQYEPGLPASGMTMFGESGFLIGREAFTSSQELPKTVLHELYRLNTSTSLTGVSAELAAQETKAAFDFAERAFKELIK